MAAPHQEPDDAIANLPRHALDLFGLELGQRVERRARERVGRFVDTVQDECIEVNTWIER